MNSLLANNVHNLVIELVMRADFDRNKFADDEHVDGNSLSGAELPDKFEITIG